VLLTRPKTLCPDPDRPCAGADYRGREGRYHHHLPHLRKLFFAISRRSLRWHARGGRDERHCEQCRHHISGARTLTTLRGAISPRWIRIYSFSTIITRDRGFPKMTTRARKNFRTISGTQTASFCAIRADHLFSCSAFSAQVTVGLRQKSRNDAKCLNWVRAQ